jgi:hypothetical protein
MKLHLLPKQTQQPKQQQQPLMPPLRQNEKQKPPLKLTYRIPLHLRHLPTWQQKQQPKQPKQPWQQQTLPYSRRQTLPYLQNETWHESLNVNDFVSAFVNDFVNAFACVGGDHLIVNLNLSLYIY